MAGLVTLVEQHMDRQLPTVVIRATIEWEVLALVKLQEYGLGVHLPVKVCCITCSLIVTFTHFKKLYKQNKLIYDLSAGTGHRPSPQFSLLVVLFKRANCSDILGTLMLR